MTPSELQYATLISFLLTRPLRDVTIPFCKSNKLIIISTHTPLAGRDLGHISCCGLPKISTHTPLAGRDLVIWFFRHLLFISTHTPLAGRDGTEYGGILGEKISTHTPLAGRDPSRPVLSLIFLSFLLTRPLRDVTVFSDRINSVSSDFYSHAPCGT